MDLGHPKSHLSESGLYKQSGIASLSTIIRRPTSAGKMAHWYESTAQTVRQAAERYRMKRCVLACVSSRSVGWRAIVNILLFCTSIGCQNIMSS